MIKRLIRRKIRPELNPLKEMEDKVEPKQLKIIDEKNH
jgi:hypothetical protein